MSLTNLGLNQDPLLCSIFVIFFTCWRVFLWCFFVWHFRTNRIIIQRWSILFNIFELKLKLGVFHPNFKIGLYFSSLYYDLSPIASPTAAPFPTILFAAPKWLTSGDLLNLVGGIHIPALLFNVSTAESLWFTHCSATVLTESVVRFNTIQYLNLFYPWMNMRVILTSPSNIALASSIF